MSADRLHGIVIYASKYSEPFMAIARRANGECFLIKTRPPAGVYYTPPTVLTFKATGTSAQGPDGQSLPVADSVQLVSSPPSINVAPYIKGVVRKAYDTPSKAHLYIEYNEDITVHTSHRPRIYQQDLATGSYVPHEGALIMFTTHSVVRGTKRYNRVHHIVPDTSNLQTGRACIAPPELVKHLHAKGHDIFVGAFDDNDETISDCPVFTDVDLKYNLPKGASLGKLSLDTILKRLTTKYADLEQKVKAELELLKDEEEDAERSAQMNVKLIDIATCRRRLRDIGKNNPGIACNLSFLQKGFTGATHASFTTAEISQWVGSFCNKSAHADSIRRVTLVEPVHHLATAQNLYELHPPEENHFFLRGAPNRLVEVTLTDMLHLGTFDPDAKPAGFDFTHSTRFTRLQLLEFRGGSAPSVGPHPRSPPIREITLTPEDMDESSSSGEAREAQDYMLAHSLVYSVATDKRKQTTDLTYPIIETLAGFSSPATVSSHQYSNHDATFSSIEEMEAALSGINQYGLGVACGMRAEYFYSRQEDEKAKVFNLVLGSGGAKATLGKLSRLLPGAHFVFLTNYVVRVHSPKLHVNAVIKALTRFHAFELSHGERPLLAALASDAVDNGVHYFTPPRQSAPRWQPRRPRTDIVLEVSPTDSCFLISGAVRAFSTASLHKLVAAFVPVAKDSPGVVSCRWVSAPSGEPFICVAATPQLVSEALSRESVRAGERTFHARRYIRQQVPIEGRALFAAAGQASSAPLVFPQAPPKEAAPGPPQNPDIVSRFFEHTRQQSQRAQARSPPGSPGRSSLPSPQEQDEIEELENPAWQMPPPARRNSKRMGTVPLASPTSSSPRSRTNTPSQSPAQAQANAGNAEKRPEDSDPGPKTPTRKERTPAHASSPVDTGTGLRDEQEDKHAEDDDVDDELPRVEDVLVGTTPGKNSKRRGSPSLPVTPAKRTEKDGASSSARPRSGSLSAFFGSATPPSESDPPNRSTSPSTSSGPAARSNAATGKNRLQDKNSQHSSKGHQKSKKAVNQRTLRRKK